MKLSIPKEVTLVIKQLEKAGYQAFLVGGCVRDLLLGLSLSNGRNVEPKDWDIATNAKPQEVQQIFPDSVYENEFGTVGVKTESDDPKLKVIEVTTFRIEGKYSDKRHPDEVKFAKTIEEDLSRRDFTVNAMALRSTIDNEQLTVDQSHLSVVNGQWLLIDPFGGQEDLKKGIVRTVGDPVKRFNEDALRLMRAVRFAVELDFALDIAARRAVESQSQMLEMIAKERVRDELIKIIMTRRAADGIILLEELNLLVYVLPELRDGLCVGQNKHHIYTVFEHNVKSLDYAAKQDYPLLIRIASLLHDVGKPKTKQGDGYDCTFYNHERVGAKIAVRMLDRLHFPKNFIEHVVHLVRYHMFYYNVGEVSPAGVRRFLVRVGPENVDNLIRVREADRIGSGVPKAIPYKLRHFLFMIDKVKHDPLSPKMLKVNGEDVMRLTGASPGPRIGSILQVLLEDVLDNPDKNTAESLQSRIKELNKIGDKELTSMAQKARETKEEAETDIEEDLKKKYHVK